MRPIFDASTFTNAWVPFAEQAQSLREADRDAMAKAAREAGEWEELAGIYQRDRDEARERLRRSEEQLAATREELAAAEIRAALMTLAEPAEDLDSDRTIADAVWDAAGHHQGNLYFSDRLEEQLASIHALAIPPTKMKRALDVLSDLAKALREGNGRLGCDIVKWVRERGFDASGESETKSTNLHRFRIAGRDQEQALHMKLSEATAPDRCVRIYFAPRADHTGIDIGYVGSKKGL